MKPTDYTKYINMQELKEALEKRKQESIGTTFSNNVYSIQDIEFAGSINWPEINPRTDEVMEEKVKDIYISIEKNFEGDYIIYYYDEEQNLLAIDMQDNRGIMSTDKSIDYAFHEKNDIIDFQTQFKNLKTKDNLSLNELDAELDTISQELNIPKEQILSNLKEMNTDLEKISKELGISKEQIISVSKSLNSNSENKDKKDEKIKLKEDEEQSSNQKQENPQNKDQKKDNPNIKQETDLSQKVNEKYTLGDVLGVQEGEKLVAVYSSAVENNQTTTKFTFLIEDKDGNFSRCDNLQQIAGNSPTNDIYASNYNGYDVQKTNVNSMYQVKSPLSSENYVLTSNIGTMGTVDLGLGQAPKLKGINNSETSLVTTPLKTSSTYNTKTEVKENLLSYHSEKYKADKRSNEAKMHNDGCEITMYEVDGDTSTGHQHSTISDEEMDNMLQKLWQEKEDEYFSYDSFTSDFFKTYLDNNLSPSAEEFDAACKRCENEHSRTNNSN